MSTGNINFSINNLPKVDRHFNDLVKTPVVNQIQNAQITQNETAHKLQMPVEITYTEPKITEPDARKKENPKKKKRIKKQEKKRGNGRNRKNDNGYFIDVEG